MDDSEIQDLLTGEPQPASREAITKNFLYNNVVPEWLKDTPGKPMPPEGTPPGKFGPPSGPPSPGDVAGGALGEVLKALAPGKVAGAVGAAATKALPLFKGIFAGPMAKMANPENYALADTLKRAGAHPEFIHDNTGVFQDVAGNWMHEISDKGMTPRGPGTTLRGASFNGDLEQFVNHPELFKNYPEMQGLKTSIDPNYGDAGRAAYTSPYKGAPAKITIGGEMGIRGLTPEQQTTLVHELNHHVQELEGFPQGGNPRWAGVSTKNALFQMATHPEIGRDPNKLNKVLDALDKYGEADRNKLEYGMYHQLPGEVASRNTATRFLWDKYGQVLRASPNQNILNFDPHGQINPEAGHNYMNNWNEISKYPWNTEDVPRHQQFDYIRNALQAIDRYGKK